MHPLSRDAARRRRHENPMTSPADFLPREGRRRGEKGARAQHSSRLSASLGR